MKIILTYVVFDILHSEHVVLFYNLYDYSRRV